MTVLVNGVRNQLIDQWETIYVASGNGVRITAFTATNTTEVNVDFKAAITTSEDTFGETLPLTTIVRDRANPGWELVNQDIPSGGTLKVQASEAAGVEFRVTGKIL
jgi:hypothetical protein